MSFLSKEEKKELRGFKRFIKAEIVGWLFFIVIVLAGLSSAFGGLDLAKRRFLDRAKINISRENFEQSKSRLHGLADDLAKYKYELSTEKDPIVRKAIVELVIDRTSSLDVDMLEDSSLRRFVIDIKNGKYNK